MTLFVVFAIMLAFLVLGALVSYAAARYFSRTYAIPAPANEKLAPRLSPENSRIRESYDARRDALLEGERRRRANERPFDD